MKSNIGGADRLARFVVGAVLLVAGIAAVAELLAVDQVIGVVAILAGVILVATSATRMCPMYRILGIDTCKR